jgi:predicted dehydrogenase
MNPTLHVGIAGVAHPKAGVYAAALREIAGTALAGIWDGLERGNAFAAEYGVIHYPDLGQLAARSDALIVASETIQHPALVTLAAQAGLPALCVPPLATTLGNARSMIEVCERSGTELGIASPLRYHHSLEQLREAIQTGALGELLFIRAAGPGAYPANDWLADSVLAGGGVLLERAAPLADLLLWIVGRDVRQVYAEVATFRSGGLVEDTALLLLSFDGGLGASLDPSWSRPAGNTGEGELTIEITGTNGVAQVDAFAQYVELFSDDPARDERRAWGDNLDQLMLADWLRAVRAGGRAPIGAAEGLRSLEIAFAAYRSAELHAPVLVDRQH